MFSFLALYGSPLQYSCLENPVDRGAWQATVCGVTKNWTQLKWLSTHTVCKYLLTCGMYNADLLYWTVYFIQLVHPASSTVPGTQQVINNGRKEGRKEILEILLHQALGSRAGQCLQLAALNSIHHCGKAGETATSSSQDSGGGLTCTPSGWWPACELSRVRHSGCISLLVSSGSEGPLTL